MARACSMNWEDRIAYGLLTRNPERKRWLERRVDNIKMDLRDMGGMDWIYLAQDRI
jgi:hypothetical protein